MRVKVKIHFLIAIRQVTTLHFSFLFVTNEIRIVATATIIAGVLGKNSKLHTRKQAISPKNESELKKIQIRPQGLCWVYANEDSVGLVDKNIYKMRHIFNKSKFHNFTGVHVNCYCIPFTNAPINQFTNICSSLIVPHYSD